MPLLTYRTGVVAPDGYEETMTEHFCDFPGCKQPALKAHGLCEEHYQPPEDEPPEIEWGPEAV